MIAKIHVNIIKKENKHFYMSITYIYGLLLIKKKQFGYGRSSAAAKILF